jgi:hypothetical protein
MLRQYTEGWVDEELSETKAGDDMGVEKIVNALIDPDENTFDPEDEDSNDEDFVPSRSEAKRKRGEDDDVAEDNKRARNA